MVRQKYPPIALLSQVFIYSSGSLFWKNRPLEHFVDERAWKIWNTRYAGKEAGCERFDEAENKWRWVVTLCRKKIFRSIVVWAIHDKQWPILEIDHIDNSNPLNDRIENLRLATHRQNCFNTTKRSDNSSGFKGVSWDSVNSRWAARIMVGGKSIFLGRFNTREEAHAAYCEAAHKYFGEFACTK